jgi:lipopolysaccharide biosynthesis glycosyltransferase
LVKSIRKYFQNSCIYQCTDLTSKEIDGVDKVFRYDGDIKNLMTFRLEIFSLLNIQEKAIYLDTDMLVINKFDIDKKFGNFVLF